MVMLHPCAKMDMHDFRKELLPSEIAATKKRKLWISKNYLDRDREKLIMENNL